MRKTKLKSLGLLLAYLTVGWNIINTVVAMVLGLKTESVALVGLALDSLIDVFAAGVVIWQLQAGNKERDQQALRLIGTAFFVLATFILVESVNALLDQERPGDSGFAMIWLVVTFVIMLVLAISKDVVGSKLNNFVLKSEAHMTLIDAYLAASVFLSLLLNTYLGWWWADAAAGLVIILYAFKEGWNAWVESSQTQETGH
ncbi:MAG: cation transporter [Nodularia sp. (in: Bacteria)]|nr:MAG: cation transporter [Nodularia sp. (in: cyanobacteria)]